MVTCMGSFCQQRGSSEYLAMYINLFGIRPWTFMDLHGPSWTFMDLHGPSWTSSKNHGAGYGKKAPCSSHHPCWTAQLRALAKSSRLPGEVCGTGKRLAGQSSDIRDLSHFPKGSQRQHLTICDMFAYISKDKAL